MSTENQGLDFGTVKAAEGKSFLTPGVYDLQAVAAKFEKSEDPNKSSFVAITFAGDAGQTIQKFYISPKSADRLQYLHEKLFDKPLAKAFETMDAIGMYFQKAVEAKKPTKRMLIGGREGTDGRVYADLGYANFIVDDDTPLGAFTEGSTQWTNNVKKNKDRGMLQGNGATLPSSGLPASTDDDDLPF